MLRYSVTHVLSCSFNRVGINFVNFVGAGRNKVQLRNFTMSGYSVIERGTPNSPNYRVFLSKLV